MIPEEILNQVDQEFGDNSSIQFYSLISDEELLQHELTLPDENSIYISFKNTI